MRALLLFLLSCLPCFAQLNVQQPIFGATGPPPNPLTMIVRFDSDTWVTNSADESPPSGSGYVKSWGTNYGGTQNWFMQQLGPDGRRLAYVPNGGPNNKPYISANIGANHNLTNLNVNVSPPFLACIIARQTQAGADYGYLLDGNTSRGLMVYHNNGNTTNLALAAVTCASYSGANGILRNTWYLMSFWVGGTNSFIRTNGVACGPASSANTCFTIPVTGLSMGSGWADGYPYGGDFCAFRMYSWTNNVCPTNYVRMAEQHMGSYYGITIP